ncbi:MAG: RsmF rRNA methyltransferase first C-terminal domain-containing protein [Lachnospiraceae bacterium]|nr:RsmF rRNA methyltransferase first C-terminal domain-containing protein [Lachnospiraceae bacterium]
MSLLPLEFENRMKDMLGSEYDDFLRSYDDTKKVGIRVNTLKNSVEEFKEVFPYNLREVKWCDTGFIADGDEKYGRLALHDAGAFYMQEPSAMAVVSAVKSVVDLRGLKVLDLCAAPGGKSTQLAAAMQGEGLLVSNEINRDRALILSSNIERMGVKNAVVLNETPDRIADAFEEYFDVIVVDAPCSGEGMFRKDDTAITEWSLENVSMCAERQKDILDAIVHSLKPGGILAYSTCTFAPLEDEIQIANLLSEYPEFELMDVPVFEYFDKGHAEWLTDEYMSDISDSIKKCARLWPHKIEGEGHFICVLRKSGEPDDNTSDRSSKKKKEKNNNQIDRKSFEIVEKFFQENIKGFSLTREDVIVSSEYVYLLPSGIDRDLKKLKVIRSGLQLGMIKKDRFEPSHSLAMALRKDEAVRCIELGEDEALSFRHGEELRIECDNGWTLICVNGVSLGWGKAVNGQIKNHYPKGLRIKF